MHCLAEARHIAGGRRRAEIDAQAEGTLERIHRIERTIAMTRATDPAVAAVQLRRLGAMLDGDAEAGLLLRSALGVMVTAGVGEPPQCWRRARNRMRNPCAQVPEAADADGRRYQGRSMTRAHRRARPSGG